MATLQVKGIDDRLYKALGARAAMDNRSVSQEVVTIIQEFLARPCPDANEGTRDLLQLAGSWEDERSAAAIVSDLRKARRSRSRAARTRNVLA